MIETNGEKPGDSIVLVNGRELIPNTSLGGFEDLADVHVFMLRLAEEREGERIAGIASPFTQLTDAAQGQGWKFSALSVPTVVYKGQDALNDSWAPAKGGPLKRGEYERRPGYRETVSGLAFVVRQSFKLDFRPGEIKKEVVIGRGESTGLVKCATNPIEGNRSPETVWRSKQTAIGRAMCNAVSVGSQGVGRRR